MHNYFETKERASLVPANLTTSFNEGQIERRIMLAVVFTFFCFLVLR